MSESFVDKAAEAVPLLVLALLEALLALLLPLAGKLLDLLWRRVLDKLAVLVEAGPLGQTIGDVNAALAVEHVKSRK